MTGELSSRDPSYLMDGPARMQPPGPGTRLFRAEPVPAAHRSSDLHVLIGDERVAQCVGP